VEDIGQLLCFGLSFEHEARPAHRCWLHGLVPSARRCLPWHLNEGLRTAFVENYAGI
jgi:hypothetical protein